MLDRCAMLVKIEKDLLIQNVKNLFESIEQKVGEEDSFTLDLSDVSAVDGAGLQLLMHFNNRSKSKNGRLFLKGLNPDVQRTFSFFRCQFECQE